MSNNIKIFLSYKDKHEVLKSDILTPVQGGRAVADEVFEDMYGDDTDDNVSLDNPKYNELSTQYWVWKHYAQLGEPDYVGFMHYRRHFIFDDNFNRDDKKSWQTGMPIYEVEAFTKECRDNISDENIIKTLSSNADCYVIEPYDIKCYDNNDTYMKEHYINTIPGAKRINWNAFEQAMHEVYPQYDDIFEEFKYGHHINCCNMFIMKKELFFEYSEFCFNILKRVNEIVDSSYYNPQEMRFLGYLGEYVLTMFVMILKRRNVNIQYLRAVLIRHFDKKIADEVQAEEIIHPQAKPEEKSAVQKPAPETTSVQTTETKETPASAPKQVENKTTEEKTQKTKLPFYKYLLSVTDEDNKKVLRIFGIKFKFKKKKNEVLELVKVLLDKQNLTIKKSDSAIKNTNMVIKKTDDAINKSNIVIKKSDEMLKNSQISINKANEALRRIREAELRIADMNVKIANQQKQIFILTNKVTELQEKIILSK